MLQLEAQARPGLTDGYMRRFAQSVPEMAHMAMVLALVFGVLAAMAVCSLHPGPKAVEAVVEAVEHRAGQHAQRPG